MDMKAVEMVEVEQHRTLRHNSTCLLLPITTSINSISGRNSYLVLSASELEMSTVEHPQHAAE